MQVSPVAMLCLSFPVSKTAHCLLGEVSGSSEVRYGRQTGFDVGYSQTRPQTAQKGIAVSLEPVAQSCPCVLRCPIAPHFPLPGHCQHPTCSTQRAPQPSSPSCLSQDGVNHPLEPPRSPGGLQRVLRTTGPGPGPWGVTAWVQARELGWMRAGAWAQERLCQVMDESGVTVGTDMASLCTAGSR